MVVAFAAADEAGALLDGVGDEGFQAVEGSCGDGGTHVWGAGGRRIEEDGAQAEVLDARSDQFEKLIVDAREGDDALHADAVLAGGLEDSAHHHGRDGGNFADGAGIVEDDCRVLAAQFDGDGGQGLGGRFADLVGDGSGSDEGELRNVWVGSQGVGDVGQAHDALDQVAGVAAAGQRTANDLEEERGRPGGLLGGLHDNAVACENGADHRTDEVVEGVVPGDAGGDDAEGFVGHHVLLVHHEEVGRPSFGGQGLLAVVNGPFQFLCGDEDFAKGCIHFCLSRVQAADGGELVLVFQYVSAGGS